MSFVWKKIYLWKELSLFFNVLFYPPRTCEIYPWSLIIFSCIYSYFRDALWRFCTLIYGSVIFHMSEKPRANYQVTSKLNRGLKIASDPQAHSQFHSYSPSLNSPDRERLLVKLNKEHFITCHGTALGRLGCCVLLKIPRPIWQFSCVVSLLWLSSTHLTTLTLSNGPSRMLKHPS